ncbi:MAG TPA: alpha/beta fold hydrolase [Gemmatimonadaceae bacterium]|nr:alpha/beta fold hydrolase [Gemmatimonadaceae bacterium]
MTRRLALTALMACATAAAAQNPPAGAAPQRGRGGQRGGPPWRTAADTARAHRLYVSTNPADMPTIDSAQGAAQIAQRLKTEQFFREKSKGVLDFQTVSFRSNADGLEIPAYVFAPLNKRGAKGHAAIVMVHGYVHGRFEDRQLVWVREAVSKGYVVVAPQYRGSTGFGADFYNAIDYGGKEIDDAESAYDYIKNNLAYVDPERVGIIGWSHGGFITAHILFRDGQPFKAGAPIVPVTNLIFRLGTHAPSYAQPFASRPEVHGMPFENLDEYVKRSPVFHVDHLKVPILVNVATNDCDVNFIEDQQMVYTLRALKPELADTKIYVDPPYLLAGGKNGKDPKVDGQGALGGCGHTFSERVVLDPNSPRYMERDDSPEQIDAWNRIWAFFARNLHPEQGK